MILRSTKNLILPGICKLQPWFLDPFRVMSIGPATYSLDLPLSMTAVQLWFHTSLFKPAGPKLAGPTALADDSHKVEAILKINKCETYAKVKWMGYDSSHNQWIRLSKLWDTAPEVMKTFLKGKERAKVSLRPRKKIWEIVLVLSFVVFYVYRLVKVKVINTRVIKFKKVVNHCSQACSCIVLMFYTALGGPSWILPLVR